jgi:hypothetical protein
MATFDGKGIKPSSTFFVAQSSTSEGDTANLNFSDGDGVYQIRITFIYNSWFLAQSSQTARPYMGGIKFRDENDNDCSWYSSSVTMLNTSFRHQRYFGITQSNPVTATTWVHDPDVWIPHHWGSTTDAQLYNFGSQPAWYDIYVKSDPGGRHMVWGAKNDRRGASGNARGDIHDGRIMAVSQTTTRPQKISIVRPFALYWTQLSMQATKIMEA